jgi:2,3-bisphosphoglycerate-independent phosphoglycerate mutase
MFQHSLKQMKLVTSLARENQRKILLVVLDGVGGLGVGGRTELEAASTPGLDALSRKGACGLTIPVLPGITPGSGPSHLALFGYDPVAFGIERGALEVYGVGETLEANQVGARGNFCTIDREGIVQDRRAGRLSTEENSRLCALLNEKAGMIEDISIRFIPGKEHRFVLLLTGVGLDPRLTDTDPHEELQHCASCRAGSREAQKSAEVVNALTGAAISALQEEKQATGIILRGFSGRPDIPTLRDLYLLTPCAIATYPMYKGIASLVGMDIIDCGSTIEDQVESLERVFDKYDFVYFHYKATDMAGEDGDFERKVRLIEEFDGFVERIGRLEPDVFVITSDHSTPALMKKHSWHPNPFLLVSAHARSDGVVRFTEAECSSGCLGIFEAKYAMALMLAHAGKLDKYGA